MKLRIVALGHRMPAWVTAGFDDYAKRMPLEFAVDLVELKLEARDRGQLLRGEADHVPCCSVGRDVQRASGRSAR